MITDGIILDIDGTIWDTTEIVAVAWNNAKNVNFSYLPQITSSQLKEQFGKPMNEIAESLFPTLTAQQQEILLEECCIQEQKELSKINCDLTFEGVVDTIKTLSKSFNLFIVSNCQKGYCELVIQKNGLQNLIKDFECFGNNGKSKDQNISLIIQRNNLQKPVYVGDTQGDSDSCAKIGVPFIWASYGFGKNVTCTKKIDLFTDLLTVFKNL